MVRLLLGMVLLFFLAPLLLPALAVGVVVALIALPFKLVFGFFCA